MKATGHKLKIGLRLLALDTFNTKNSENFQGDELIGRNWVMFLERRDDVERVAIYGKEEAVANDLDVLIHFNPMLEKHPSIPNICYSQNAFRREDYPGGTFAVFGQWSGDFKAHIFTSAPLRDACASGAVIPFCTNPELFRPTFDPSFSYPVSFAGNPIRRPRDHRRFLEPAIRYGLGLYHNG
jgi:hypothetical protein